MSLSLDQLLSSPALLSGARARTRAKCEADAACNLPEMTSATPASFSNSPHFPGPLHLIAYGIISPRLGVMPVHFVFFAAKGRLALVINMTDLQTSGCSKCLTRPSARACAWRCPPELEAGPSHRPLPRLSFQMFQMNGPCLALTCAALGP